MDEQGLVIGERIKHARKKMRWSQEKLAELMGVSGTTVVNWETGKKPPGRKMMIGLSHLFHTSMSWITGDSPLDGPGSNEHLTDAELADEEYWAEAARDVRSKLAERAEPSAPASPVELLQSLRTDWFKLGETITELEKIVRAESNVTPIGAAKSAGKIPAYTAQQFPYAPEPAGEESAELSAAKRTRKPQNPKNGKKSE